MWIRAESLVSFRPCVTFAAIVLTLTVAASLPASACGPSTPRPIFWFSYAPDDPDRFLGGDLGVLSPELEKGYLYAAYRHAVGLGLDAPSRAALEEFLTAPANDPWRYDAMRRWDEAVREVTGQRREVRYRQPQVYLTRPDGGYGGYFINCLQAAFRAAVDTLRARAEVYSSSELDAWIDAQDAVFDTCGGDSQSVTLPQALPESASVLARADRAYQIAAAHFYLRDFSEARRRFRDIAADRASPWSDLAAYLEARCLIRSSTVGFLPREERFSEAREVLRSIVADPSRAAVHEMSQRLGQYIEIRLDPDGARDRLRERLLAPRLEAPIRQDLIDYFWLLKRIERERIATLPDLDRWVMTVRRHHDRSAAERATKIWESLEAAGGADPTATLFMAAALALAERPTGMAAVSRAADGVSEESPLFASIQFHRARLLAAGRDSDAARARLTAMLERVGERLSRGDRNRILLLLAELAPTLEERIRLGQQEPVGFSWWGYEGEGTDQSLTSGPRYFESLVGQTLPADVAIEALNLSSSERLMRVLSDESIEPALKKRLAPIAWTRAVLAAEEEAALRVEPLAAEAAPEAAGELERYRRAAPGEERLFVGALAILRLPGLRPTLRHGFGRQGVHSFWDDEEPGGVDAFSYIRDNWWCLDPMHGTSARTFARLLSDDRAEAERAMNAFKDLPPAPTHLGHIVLGWAEIHREDPRVPESLHRVVRGSRVCGGGEISRVAFQTLHRRYPDSEWAAKTKYWYR